MPVGLKDMSRQEVKYASISGSGTIAIVAAIAATAKGDFPAKKINVISYVLGGSGTSTAIFKSGTTALSGAIPVTATGTVVGPWNPDGWFETAAGEALNVTIASGNGVGHISYIETW